MAFSLSMSRAVPLCHGKLTAAQLLSFERGKNRYKAGTRGVICAFIGWSSGKSTDNRIQSLAETSRYCCTDATSSTSKATMQGSALRLGKAALTQHSMWATNRTLVGFCTSCLHLSFLCLRKLTDWDHTDKSPFISMSVTTPTHTAQGSIQSRHRRLRKTSLLPYSFAAACFCKLQIPFPVSSKCL